MPSDDVLDRLDSEAAEFSGATSREYYLNYAGLKDDLALGPIFEKHAGLFSRAAVDGVLALKTKDERYPHLREFVVGGYLEQAAKELTEEIAARETEDSIEWEGGQVPYRSVSQLVMNEPDPSRRHELDRRRLEVTSKQNTLRQKRWVAQYEKSRELGFGSYVAMCETLGALNLDDLRRTMERFLWDTEGSYRDRLAIELRAAGVDPGLAERSDLSRLLRSPQFDASFPRERMLPAMDATLRALGVDVDHQSNVIVDAEERPKKSPRAFCAPVEIPGEIYLVISPHGGHDDYRAFFHEGGHAQHFAHIAGEQPFAYRGLGDNSVTEGFAFVLEHLVYQPAWLEQHLGMTESGEYVSFSRFYQLYFLRRYAAKLLYELELHANEDVLAMGKRYADLLTGHVGVRYDPEDYLSDVDDGFYCARYLRAWTFDAQVRAWFARTWGDAWYTVPEAGAKLRELWSFGQRYPVEELLRQLGDPGLDVGPLVAELAL